MDLSNTLSHAQLECLTISFPSFRTATQDSRKHGVELGLRLPTREMLRPPLFVPEHVNRIIHVPQENSVIHFHTFRERIFSFSNSYYCYSSDKTARELQSWCRRIGALYCLHAVRHINILLYIRPIFIQDKGRQTKKSHLSTATINQFVRTHLNLFPFSRIPHHGPID